MVPYSGQGTCLEVVQNGVEIDLSSSANSLNEDLSRQVECIGHGKTPDAAQQLQHINT